MFLWLHFIPRIWFGSKKFVPISRIDIDLLKGEEDSIAKYYVYLIPIIPFIIPFIANIWARWKYIGFNDENDENV